MSTAEAPTHLHENPLVLATPPDGAAEAETVTFRIR